MNPNIKEFIKIADEQTTGKGTTDSASLFVRQNKGLKDDLKIEISFGVGRASTIPWIAFTGFNQTVKNGIYPVYLYFKNFNLLILSYGLSETNPPKKNWYNINSKKSIKDFLINSGFKKPERYGNSYVFKTYNTDALPEESVLDHDLNLIIKEYLFRFSDINVYKKVEHLKAMPNSVFQLKKFQKNLNSSFLLFSNSHVLRLVSSLLAKPFLILSGLSGSGKTKIAQSFATWICESEDQYKIVPVGADWTNREPLLGYPNGLEANEYITPDSGVIHLLLNAIKPENEKRPFFLILDEMNLSHVERYFADFLSIMESKDTIKLYTGNKRKSTDKLSIPSDIGWPKNVFIIGTVNIDETTYMFSPKVLDRANVIEFRITETEITEFLKNPSVPDLSKLKGNGVSMAEDFLNLALEKRIDVSSDLTKELVSFFNCLKLVGAEFGYRSASEIMQLISKLKLIDKEISDFDCLDIAIMQKLLPKLHGSRSKLIKILITLLGLCIDGISKEEFEKQFDVHYLSGFAGISIKFPISFEKLIRMYKNVLANGFTSYAEA
jgi:5-methylcytosine-specific restriction enzyme B